MFPKIATTALAFTTAVAAAPLSNAQHSNETRAAGSHVHGALEVVVSVDGEIATVELQSAMWNLVGYEHAPTNEIEADRWVATANRLKAPATIVMFPEAAGCTLKSSALGPFAAAAGLGAHDDHHDHGDDDHDHHHDHGEDHEHGDYHDALLSWTYKCDAPDAIRSVTFPLFERFSGVESAEAALFTSNGQAAGNLTPGANTLRIG